MTKLTESEFLSQVLHFLVFLPSPKRKVKNLIKEYYQTFSDVLKKGNEACLDVLLGNVLSIKNILTVYMELNWST